MRADLFHDLTQAAVALSPERVFAIACDKEALDVLVDARDFFKARSTRAFSAAAPVSEADAIVCGAIVRCALVAAERYVVGKVEEGADRHRPNHDPVRSSDHLVACIEAAMRLGFGLCFSAGNPQPENVFCLVHPLPEPGVRGEEGAALSAAELLATLERGELQAGRDFDPKYVKTIIEKRSKELRTGLVVSAEAEGRLQSADRRAELLQYLQDEFELRTFFHQRAYETMPRWAKEMQDTLLHALGPIFAISRENVKTKEESMSEREPERSAPPAFTHLTMNFNASVGTVAQANAPGAQAAARDIVIGSPLADLPQAFAAVQKAIDDGSSPHEGEQRRSMSSQLSEVREVLQSEARSTDDGHRVKSCLDGLEKTAKAVTNAQAVHKALAPIWEGAKYYWPTLF